MGRPVNRSSTGKHTGAGIERREFLAAGVGGAMGLGLFSQLGLAEPGVHGLLGSRAATGPGARTLVILQLSGGNDGLSTVIPYADDAYHRARPTIAHPAKSVLRIDDHVGLHPSLERLHGMTMDGRLAVLQGIGYSQPNRSHFKSMEIWHTADERGRNSGDGWVGRLCDAAFGDDALATRVVHAGGMPPYALHSRTHPAISFTVPAGYRWAKEPGSLADGKDPERRSKDDALGFLRGVMRDAQSSSEAVRQAAARYRPLVAYPDDPFADSLRALAALINSDVGGRVLSTSLGGFDTHNSEKNRHDTLMRRFDAGLGAFLDDLQSSEAGRNTVVMVFSEFGRRVAENGSRGTDHGTAGPMFVAGAKVKGGLHGAHPSLIKLDKGDLIFHTDFRSVYGAVIEECFGIPHERALGKRYRTAKLFA